MYVQECPRPEHSYAPLRGFYQIPRALMLCMVYNIDTTTLFLLFWLCPSSASLLSVHVCADVYVCCVCNIRSFFAPIVLIVRKTIARGDRTNAVVVTHMVGWLGVHAPPIVCHHRCRVCVCVLYVSECDDFELGALRSLWSVYCSVLLLCAIESTICAGIECLTALNMGCGTLSLRRPPWGKWFANPIASDPRWCLHICDQRPEQIDSLSLIRIVLLFYWIIIMSTHYRHALISIVDVVLDDF